MLEKCNTLPAYIFYVYSCIMGRMRKTISNRQPSKSIVSNRQSSESIELIEIERFKKCSKTFMIKNNLEFIDYKQFLNYALDKIILKLKQSCLQTSIKFNLNVESVYERIITQEVQNMVFKTSNILACNSSDFNKILNKMINKILVEVDTFVSKKSGWSLVKIDRLQLRINMVNPLKGYT